jgi:hypothetical protein
VEGVEKEKVGGKESSQSTRSDEEDGGIARSWRKDGRGY